MPSNPPVLGPAQILERVKSALAQLLVRPTPAGNEPFDLDRKTFLSSSSGFGQPRLFEVEGVPTRYLTPLEFSGLIGGLVASDPHTGEVVSWPAWAPGPVPLFLLTPEEIRRRLREGHPAVHEHLPATRKTPTRFGVDPARIEGATLVDNWDSLPFKNQEERHGWVEAVNRSGRMRTRWRYRTGWQEPTFKCLSYASSTVADWWGLTCGQPITASYRSFVNGSQEYGVDPRSLEVLYSTRAARQGRLYRLSPRSRWSVDPVTRERIPASLMGFAHLLTTPDSGVVPDPLTRDGLPSHVFRPRMFHMDGPPLHLFARGQSDPALLREALNRHGVVLAMTQTRLFGLVRVGLHAIVLIGHFERDGETVFVYHESYGHHEAGYTWDNSGGPSHMTIPARMLREAACFPHRIWMDVSAVDGELVVRPCHLGGGFLAGTTLGVEVGGRMVDVPSSGSEHRVTGPVNPGMLRLDARRTAFLAPSGRPHQLAIPWPGRGPALAAALMGWLVAEDQRSSVTPEFRPTALDQWRDAKLAQVVAVLRSPADPGEDAGMQRWLGVLTDGHRRRVADELPPILAQLGVAPDRRARLESWARGR